MIGAKNVLKLNLLLMIFYQNVYQPHVNIFYCFGGIVLTSFQFQATTGFTLTIYYQPTVVEAFSSVQFILKNVHLGWFIRSIHRWSSGVMVLILILHIARVYLTGGLKNQESSFGLQV